MFTRALDSALACEGASWREALTGTVSACFEDRRRELPGLAGDCRAMHVQSFHVLGDRTTAGRQGVRLDERDYVGRDRVVDEPRRPFDDPRDQRRTEASR